MWDDITWWLVLILTITCFLLIPGLVQIFIEEIKEQFKNNNKEK